MNRLLILLVACFIAGCATSPPDLPPDNKSSTGATPQRAPMPMPGRY